MNKLHNKTRVTEVADTALRLSELFKKTTSVQSNEFLLKITLEMEQQATALTTALSKLEEADSERDNAIRVLDKLLKGYEHIPVESLRNHAQKLIAVFNKYGVKITSENYTSQSNLIMSMLEDFSAESLKVSVDALMGVREALAEIQTKQTAFAQLRETYEGALATQKEKASAKAPFGFD